MDRRVLVNAERFHEIAAPLEEAVAAGEVRIPDVLAAVRVHIDDATEAEVIDVARELARLGLIDIHAMSSGGES